MMRHILLSLILLTNLTIYANDNIMFRHLTVHDGLADNEVKCIVKDNNGFVWYATNTAINRFDGYNIKQYLKTANNLTLSAQIEQIHVDYGGNIWIERYGYYFIYDREKDLFTDAQSLLEKYQLNPNVYPLVITMDDSKNIWSYNGKIMKYYDFKEKRTFSLDYLPEDIKFFYPQQNRLFYIDKNNQLIVSDLYRKLTVTTIDLNKVLNKEAHIDYKLYVDSNSDIWVYSSNSEGLWLLSNVGKDSWQLSSIGHASYLTNNKIRSICEDHDKKIWIGMESEGISIYDKKNKQHTHHTKTESEYSLGSNKVWCFFYDEENTMWVGTMRNGISYYNKDFFPFQKTQLPYWHDVACQVEDNNNNLWIGTDGGGIYKIDPNGRIYIFNKENRKSFSNNIVCLYNDSKGRVWAGTYLEGFGYLNGEKFEQHPFSEDFKREPNNNSIWSITEDESGNIWLGNLRNGLHVLNPITGEFHTYKRNNSDITDDHVMGIIFDKKKYIYAATCYGLNQINTETREIKGIVGNRKKTQSIKDTIQNNVFIDSRNLIWVGGREGLSIYDEKIDTLYYLNQVNKLKGSLVRGITEDNNRDIWVMTTEGITHIKVSENRAKSDYTFACQPYSNNDGLQTSDFIHGSISKNKNGHILIGGNGSFFNIDPSVTYNKSVSRVLFTRLRIFNNLIEPDSVYNGNAILSKNIELTDKIILKNSQSTFSIEFSVLEYIKAHNIQFSYRLKGVNENWNNLDGNQISFNNIAAGTYKLEVRASNSDGIWSEPTAINIVIEPPLWFSGWALTLYTILVLILIAYILYSNDRKHKKRLRYKEIELETQKQHEIYEMKLNFFTNLSHDFRTPLSLIIAPIDLLMKSNLGQEVNSTLHVIYKNAQSLLNLVNQILDFRKIEIHEMKLNLENGDYILFVNEVMNNFSGYIETNNLQLTFDKQIDNLYMQFDRNKIHKILMNLVHNAIKYADNPGEVSVKVWIEGEKVFTCVTDNGVGIEDTNKEKIFSPFYQLPDNKSIYGSGIGLHIVKQMVSMHNGEIHIENNEPKGSKFIFYIPLVKANHNTVCEENKESGTDESTLPTSAEIIKQENNVQRSTILIVEDYQDLRKFLSDSLRKEYNVFAAVDGLHALSILKKEQIDIIITDIMMPNMDGMELCRTIKSDIKTSHIPIIMLTAKSDVEHIAKGLTEGADDYIPKPFNLDILKLRINRILMWKRECHRKFALEDINTSDITSSSLDDSFIKKAIKIVEENLDNPNFSVEELSSSIGMSRSNLYNKIISIVGKTPSEFIRTLKLKRSIKYLEGTQMTVAEVAYKVGFNSPKIFTNYFKEEYKMTPTEYRKNKEV